MSQHITSNDTTAKTPDLATAAVPQSDVTPMNAAKTPVGPGSISAVGLLLALVAVGIGVVGVQAALVAAGSLTGKPWLTSALERPNGLTPSAWMLPVGVVLALVGLWLLLTALRPRPRTAVAVQAQTGVFLRPRDLARLAAAAADDVDGVQGAHASATGRRVTVRIASLAAEPDRDQVTGTVTAAVTERLSALQKPVRVVVRTVAGAGGTR